MSLISGIEKSIASHYDCVLSDVGCSAAEIAWSNHIYSKL